MPPPAKKNSPDRLHTSQLPTSLLSGSPRNELRNPPRRRGRGRNGGEGEHGTKVAKTASPATADGPSAPRAGWRDGATKALAWRPGSPDFASLRGDPCLPCHPGSRGRGRPRRRLRASSARHGRERGPGTRDNRERGALRARVAPPAGRLTDTPAARRDWVPLGPAAAAAAAARSAGVTAPPVLWVVPHLPAPPPRKGAELTLSATPSSAAAASSRVNSSTSIRREKLKGFDLEPPREAGTPGRRNGKAPPLSLHFRRRQRSQLLQNRDLPPPRSFPSSLPRFPSLAPSLFSISLLQAWDLRLLPHHVTRGRPTGTRSLTSSSHPALSLRRPRGARMRAEAGSRAGWPAASSCPLADSWDWV